MAKNPRAVTDWSCRIASHAFSISSFSIAVWVSFRSLVAAVEVVLLLMSLDIDELVLVVVFIASLLLAFAVVLADMPDDEFVISPTEAAVLVVAVSSAVITGVQSEAEATKVSLAVVVSLSRALALVSVLV